MEKDKTRARKMTKLTSSIPMPATMTAQQEDDLLVPDVLEESHPCSSNEGDVKKSRLRSIRLAIESGK